MNPSRTLQAITYAFVSAFCLRDPASCIEITPKCHEEHITCNRAREKGVRVK